MNNRQISALMRNHSRVSKIFVGVYPADMLPKKPRKDKPCAYIANTHKHNQPGEHWVCFYFPKDSLPEFWDSYGFPPQNEFKHFLGKHYLCSNKPLQHPLSSVCGQYCCLYILKRTEGFDMHSIITSFTNDLIQNDILVNLIIEKTFCVDYDVISFPFLSKQISKSFLR